MAASGTITQVVVIVLPLAHRGAWPRDAIGKEDCRYPNTSSLPSPSISAHSMNLNSSLAIPAFTLQLQQENSNLYMTEGETEGDSSSFSPSPLWGHLQDFFKNTLISVAGNSGWGRPSRQPTPPPGQGQGEPAQPRRARHDRLLVESIGQSLTAMLQLVRDVVSSCPPLIDRVWNLYSSLLAPYADPLPSDRTTNPAA